MRYVAAYLLSSLGGNANPGAADLKKILESVGIEADDTRLDKVKQMLSIMCLMVLQQVYLWQEITLVIFTHVFSNRLCLSSQARMWRR